MRTQLWLAPSTKPLFKVTLRTSLRLTLLCRKQVFPVQVRSQTVNDVDEPRCRSVRLQSPREQQNQMNKLITTLSKHNTGCMPS